MSELDLLRRLGDHVVPPPLDELRTIARRRTRRTIVAISLGAAACVAAVLLGVHTFPAETHTAPPVKEPEPHGRPLTYAQGSTVHHGDREVALPGRVLELDLTDDGVVARVADGGIWFTDGGEPSLIGELGTPGDSSPTFGAGPGDIIAWGHPGFVVSGSYGSVAAWWEFQPHGAPELVVYDTAAGRAMARRPVPLDEGSTVLLDSVSDRFVYWYVDPVEHELDTPNARLDTRNGTVGDVSPHQYAGDRPPAGTSRTVLISHAEGGGEPYRVARGPLQLGMSPGGGNRIRVFGEQPLEALDGGTGDPFVFAAPKSYRPPETPAFLAQWLDDDSFVLAYKLDGPADLLTCRVSVRSCEVTMRSVDALLPEIG